MLIGYSMGRRCLLTDLPDSTLDLNHPMPRADICLFGDDPVARHYIERFGGDAAILTEFGDRLGSAEFREMGRQANASPPELLLFDRGGRRLDQVRFHPAYHHHLGHGLSAGYASLPWEGVSSGHATHAMMVYLQSQVEPGVACPMTMTYAAIPTLSGDLSDIWRPKLMSRNYDSSFSPLSGKTGATLGMAMTEKQGGSDVRDNTTRAERDGKGYRLFGHKWFCSAPMSDGFLTLAQATDGLTCFLVPRWCPDGSQNAIHLMRLKDKLGNRSNASAEIEYHGAWAERLGEEGDGVRQIIRMVHHTRLDTAMAPAGLMRAALSEAKWWCVGRSAFQRRLIDQPLMRSVLADLVLDWEGATALGLRVAAAYDDPEQAPFARIAVALAKFLNNKRCPNLIYETMECLGGMGYTDDTPMPLLFREAPLNSIWEGSGNVICLDILRTLTKDQDAQDLLLEELDAARGENRDFDAALSGHVKRWPGMPDEAEARWFAESLADLLTASVLIRHAPVAVSHGYVASRLSGRRGQVAGSISGLDTVALLARI